MPAGDRIAGFIDPGACQPRGKHAWSRDEPRDQGALAGACSAGRGHCALQIRLHQDHLQGACAGPLSGYACPSSCHGRHQECQDSGRTSNPPPPPPFLSFHHHTHTHPSPPRNGGHQKRQDPHGALPPPPPPPPLSPLLSSLPQATHHFQIDKHVKELASTTDSSVHLDLV